MDHETDDGEMLALQAELMRWVQLTAADAGVHPLGVRRARRPPERRQVDARQRDRRRQGGDRLRQAADDPARDPRAWPTGPTGSSCSSTCPASSARATRSPSGCSTASSTSSPTPTAACSCVNAEQGIGPGDRFIAGAAARGAGRPGGDRRQQGRPRRPRQGRPPRCRTPRRSGSAARSSRSARAPARAFPTLTEHLVVDAARGAVVLRRRISAPTRRRRSCSPSWCASRCWPAPARRFRTPSRSRSRRSTDPRDDLVRIEAVVLVGDRVPEGDPDRRPAAG